MILHLKSEAPLTDSSYTVHVFKTLLSGSPNIQSQPEPPIFVFTRKPPRIALACPWFSTKSLELQMKSRSNIRGDFFMMLKKLGSKLYFHVQVMQAKPTPRDLELGISQLWSSV